MNITVQNNLTAEHQACLALYRQNKIAECFPRVRALRQLYPDNTDLKYLAGLCRLGLNMLDEAEYLFKDCLRTVKTSAELFCNLGVVCDKKDKMEEAIAAYRNTLQLNPNHITALNNLGNIYNKIGNNIKALEYFNKIVSIGNAPYYIYNNIALVYKKLGLLQEACKAINKALESKPEDYQPYNNAAVISAAMGNKKDAMRCYEQAYKYASGNAQIIFEYAELCNAVCDWDKYAELTKQLDTLLASGHELKVTPPMGNIQRNINPKENLECAIRYTNFLSRGILAANTRYSHEGRKQHNGRIRIGYLSSDIKDHPVAHLMRGVFKHHNKEEFETFLYTSSEIHPNDKSGYREDILPCFEHVIDIRNTSNIDVAKKIYDDQIDIIIDLNGHTGLSRLEALALKPAPVQISYIGFIGSMGADFIDYVICDEIVTPPDQQQFYTEKFLYMPNCYQANDDTLKISDIETTRAEQGLPEKAFVFCSFNQTYKIEPVLFQRWMNILKRVDNSVLWIYKGSIFFADNLAKENLISHAKAAGVDPARLIFVEGIIIDKHLKRVGLADLALDTRIYNGGTVTSQTLWAGVPVLTIKGGHFASRMAASIMTAIGMPELITNTLDEYEDLAVKIATTKGAAKRLKNKLLKNKATYPLFNTKQFTKDMEQLFKNVWNDYLAKN